jgi:CMP-N,N'-diacetyllegionaminic acid synthase
MKVLAIVPARCGSKGFIDKNIKKIENKTLLELAVEVGIDCPIVNDVYVSTDCKCYEDIALNAGCKSFGLRDESLSTDSSKTIDVVIDVIQKCSTSYDYVVLLQPTSPVRAPQDIENMIALIEKNNMDASVTISSFDEPHPYKLKSISSNGMVAAFINGKTSEIPRQLLPKVYALTGAIYIVRVNTVLENKTLLPKKTIPYIMKDNINIDSEKDFIYLDIMRKLNKVKIWGVDK